MGAWRRLVVVVIAFAVIGGAVGVGYVLAGSSGGGGAEKPLTNGVSYKESVRTITFNSSGGKVWLVGTRRPLTIPRFLRRVHSLEAKAAGSPGVLRLETCLGADSDLLRMPPRRARHIIFRCLALAISPQ
jgi:hypothetical protein